MNGFVGDAMAGCTDTDECAASPCSDDGSCANNVDSFECADPANIPEHSTCENIPGSFIIHCNVGFFKADGLCHNVVECENENICVANSDCVDTIGRCDCHNGFIKAAYGSCSTLMSASKAATHVTANCRIRISNE